MEAFTPGAAEVACARQRTRQPGLAYLHHHRPPLRVPEVFTSGLAPIRPLFRAAVTHIVRAALRRAGIKAPINGAHVLRHSA